MLGELLASSERREWNASSTGLLECSLTFSGPPNVALRDFPTLALGLAGSQADDVTAPLNHTYQQPVHYMVRVRDLLY